MKKLTRLLVFAGSGIVVVLALGALFVQTDYFRGWLRSFIVRTVEGGIEGRVQLDRVEGSLVTGITLSGVAISGAGSAVVSAEEIRIVYFLPALLLKTADITQVRITAPRLTFLQEADGTWNYQHALAPKKKPARRAPARSPLAGWSFRIRKLELVDASAAVTDRRGKTLLGVPALSMSSRGTLTVMKQGLEGTVEIDVLRIEAEKPVALPFVLRGKGSFGKDGIEVGYLDITAGRSRGRLTGTLAKGAPFSIDAHADLPVVSFDDVRRFVPSVSFSSAAALTADLRGTPASFAARCSLAYGDLRVESSGTVDIPRSRVAGISRIRHFRPEKILTGFATAKTASFPSGDINLDVSLEADGDPFAAGSGTAAVTLLPSGVGAVTTPGAALGITLKNGKAELRADDLETSAGSFSVRAAANAGSFVKRDADAAGTLLVNGSHVDLAQLTGTDAAQSDLNFIASAVVNAPAGRGAGISLEGSFTASTSTVKNIALSGVSVEISVAGGTVHVRSASVQSDILRLSARGSVAPRGELDLTYSLDVSDIGVLGRWLPSFQAAGGIASTGTVRGTASRPSFSGLVSGGDLRYRGFAAGTVRLEANVTGGGAKNRLPSGELRFAAGDLKAGKTRIDGVAAQVSGDGGRTVFAVDLEKDDARRLRLDGEAVLKGDNRAQVRLATLAILAGTSAWRNTRPVQATLSPEGVSLDSFELVFSSQSLRLSGEWKKRGTIRLDAAAREIDLGSAAEAAGMPLPLTGIMRSSFTVRGTASFPEINGTLFISTGAIGGVPFDRIASTAAYAGGRTRLSLSIARDGSDVLVASGTIPGGAAGEDTSLYLAARDLDLSILSALTPAIEQASGRVYAAVLVSGSIREPKITGDLSLSGGTLRIRGAEVTYRDLQARLRMAGDTLYIDRLSLKSEEGDAAASGTVSLRGVVPESASVDITARRFMAMGSRTFSGLLDADLRLRPREDGTLLSGAVTVVEGQVHIPKATTRPGAEITVIETGAGGKARVVKAPGKATVPLVSRLAVQVEAEVPGNVWVRGNDLNAEIEGKLLLIRNPPGPVTLSGDIAAVRGTYQFRGKLLTIDAARLAFTGGPRINPELNAQASTVIDDLTIFVNLRGTLLQPRISLRSEPPRDESDVLAYLVFGRPLSKLNQSENRVVQRAAVQALGGLAVTGLRDFLGQDIAPDVIDVYSGQESGFAVGKYITNRLFIRYEWRFGLDEVRQTVLNVQLSRHFVLNSQVGSERTSGVDIIWTTNY